MTGASAVLDWTMGGEGIAFQSCPACEHRWYFRRGFCPRCGSGSPTSRQASGLGTVHAATLVTRAPSEGLRAHAPYLIVLVDADEGFRLMAHAAPQVRIGARVRCRFVPFGGRRIPFFDPA
jgi:uncharacterized protein